MLPGPVASNKVNVNVSIAKNEHDTVATVVGEIDADNCAEFGSSLLETPADRGRLIVDLHGLSFIDSSGISELLRVSQAVGDRGQEFELRDPSPAVRRVLEITGLLEHFGLD
ncbi:MAG: STAS domain-containing protein [Acidimicrobiales bacterium]